MKVLSRGERFKDAREIYNIHGKQSIDDVKNATGVSSSMISNLEDDEVDRSVGYNYVAKLAAHYGVSSDWLLGLTNDPSRTPNAVDELGLPVQVVDCIMKMNDDEIGNPNAHEGLCMFLMGTIRSPIYEMISIFYESVCKEIDNPNISAVIDALDPPRPASDTPFGPVGEQRTSEYLRRSSPAHRDMMTAYFLRRNIEKEYPELRGRLNVAFGSENLDLEFARICNYLKRYLEDITLYREYLDNWGRISDY